MQIDYEAARRLEGKLINFKNNQGDWVVGRVVKVKKDGLEIEELNDSGSNSKNGYGFGFWGPFFGPPIIYPFVGFAFSPFFLW